MPDDNKSSPKKFPVKVQTPAAEDLIETARGIIDRRNAGELKAKGAQNKFKEAIGEYGVRRYVEDTFKSSVKEELHIPRRGEKGPPILDLVFELDDGWHIVTEAKEGSSKLGRVNKKVFQMDDVAPTASKAITKNQALKRTLKRDKTTIKAVEQFSPRWFQDRIKEIGRRVTQLGSKLTNRQLANRLNRAWSEGKLIALEIYVDDDGLVKEVVDKTHEWNQFKQRWIPDEPTQTPDIGSTKPTNKPKVQDKPLPDVEAEPKGKAVEGTKPTAKSAKPPKTTPKIKATAADTPAPAVEATKSPKPEVEATKPPVTATDVKPHVDAVPEHIPKSPGPALMEKPGIGQSVKSFLNHPKVKFTLKFGAGLLLDIAIGFIIDSIEQAEMEKGWKAVEPQLQALSQEALNRAEEKGEIAKFRKGEKAEEGYQLYFRIHLKVIVRCNDGPWGYTGFFNRFELQDVQVVRASQKTHIPETGNACSDAGGKGVVYAPIFEKGEQITPGAANAGDQIFSNINGVLAKGFVSTIYWKEYLKAFYRYTQIFKDSKAAILWGALLEEMQFRKVLMGVGMLSPWQLHDMGIPFKEVVETIPWMQDGSYDTDFIQDFLKNAESWASDTQKAEWKKYYDMVAAAKRGCGYNPSDARFNGRPLLQGLPSSENKILPMAGSYIERPPNFSGKREDWRRRE